MEIWGQNKMYKTSLIKSILFLLAIFANLNYLLFIDNPVHAGNIGFYLLNAIADTIAILICLSTWVLALYFELCKSRYYRDIADLRKHGDALLQQRVAVLVTVVNEDIAIVCNTLKCAQALIGEKTVYLLDDGKRDNYRELASTMGIRYITRPDNRFYKAGNLNHALRHHVHEPFFLVMDADFAVHPTFLQRTMPCFADPRIAAVQTPQVYTSDETVFARGSKHLQDIFYHYIEPGKHLINSAFCVGTNVVFRTAAIHEVGGIEPSHSEDIFTTLHLQEHGYRILFLNEELAWGLGPTTLISFYRQQYRWARGGFFMLFKHNTLFNHKLHLEQRIQFFLTNCFYFSGISVLIYLLSPLIAILLNITPLNDAYTKEWLTAYLPFFCFNVLFGLSLLKRYRLQSLLVGIFSHIPYLNALRAEVFGWRVYKWKVTNQASKGLITTLLAPYILYLAIGGTIIAFLAMGILVYNPALLSYYVWLALDMLMMLVFIVASYVSTSQTHAPVIDRATSISVKEMSTAEVLAISGPAVQPRTIDDYPTVKVPIISQQYAWRRRK